MTLVYLSLGSNMGDRVAYLQQAVTLLNNNEAFNVTRSSALYETEPWGNKHQDWFVNAVVEAETKLSPFELLKLCQQVEQTLGRVRDGMPRWGQRTIDIDILFYGDEVISLPTLIIPHKYLHVRAFALVPLLELAPEFKHPVLDKTITQLHEELDDPDEVFLYGTIGA